MEIIKTHDPYEDDEIMANAEKQAILYASSNRGL